MNPLSLISGGTGGVTLPGSSATATSGDSTTGGQGTGGATFSFGGNNSPAPGIASLLSSPLVLMVVAAILYKVVLK